MPKIVSAEIIDLKNGDRISGEILKDTGEYLTMRSEALGVISIHKGFIKQKQEDQEVPVVVIKRWKHKLSVGYQASNGNNKNSQAHLSQVSQYKNERHEALLKAEMEYGADHGKMNSQQYFIKAQNSFRLKRHERWFTNQTLEVDHDRFANVDYRLIPSLGGGYWFSEGDRIKAEMDMAFGWEYTNYRNQTKSSSNPALIPHFYYEQMVYKQLKFIQDLTFYPSLANLSDYRLRSESSLINPIGKKLNWKMSFIEEFNTAVSGSTKKEDQMFITSLEYAF